MKLINLLTRELENCSLGDDFRVSCHAEICQLISKEHVVVIMEFPDLGHFNCLHGRVGVTDNLGVVQVSCYGCRHACICVGLSYMAFLC